MAKDEQKTTAAQEDDSNKKTSTSKQTESTGDAPTKSPAKKSVPKEARWYAVHTYSGYEEKVKENILQRIDSLDVKDKIFDVVVPKEKQIEIKNGKRRVVEKRIFQGYVLVQMVITEDSWHAVRNTPNVTGFVGSGNQPIPVSEEEMKQIRKRMGVEEPKHKIDYSVGETVNIVDGAFKGFDGTVNEVDEQKGRLKVLVNIFGRETPVELDSLQVKKM